MAAVAAGEADVAAIDCVTYALALRANRAEAAALRVLCRSDPAPALPYITAGGAGDDRLDRIRAALREAAADPELGSCRRDLLLRGFEVLPAEAYDRILAMEREAEAMGCAPLV
jgi:ABC-type phosphate/phosphonate transport system substrate-binding protein